MSFDVTTLAIAKSYTNQHGGSGGGWPADLPKPSVGGYGYTESGEQTTITWDGDTDGRVDLAGKYYKISELTPTIEEMIGGVVYTKTRNDGIFQEEITSDSITTLSEHVYNVECYGPSNVLVALENDEIEGIIIERGMYYSKEGSGVSSVYISSLTYGTPDTVHKIDGKYMPDGYPTKSVGTVTLMEEQQVAFKLNKGVYGATATNAPKIVEGQTYTVNWDGTEYECVGVISNSMSLLGNLSIMGMGDDTGEPFIYGYDIEQTAGMFATHDTSASHTISVKTTVETVIPIAEEFLPASALITYDLDTNTYSADLTNDELHARLLDGKQIVLYTTDGNEYLYLTRWKKVSSGRIDLAFAGEDYSVSLLTDGTIGKYIIA